MRLLLDTHILVWLATERHKPKASESMALATAEALLLSAVSIWEVRVKWQNSLPKALSSGLVIPEAALIFIENSPIELASSMRRTAPRRSIRRRSTATRSMKCCWSTRNGSARGY